MTSHQHHHGRAHDPDADLFQDDDDLDVDLEPRNPHASSTRWRHEESTAFRKHAQSSLQPRGAEAKSGTHDLADFLNSTRVAPVDTPRNPGGSSAPNKHTPIMLDHAPAAADDAHGVGEAAHKEPGQGLPKDGKTIACGPLLNYRRMEGTTWVGSVLVVTTGGGKTQDVAPTLLLRRAGVAQHLHADGAINGTDRDTNGAGGATEIPGSCLYSDPRNTFWRFQLRCEMAANEIKWEYSIPEMRFISKTKPQTNSFFVPAITESMRSMLRIMCGLYEWHEAQR